MVAIGTIALNDSVGLGNINQRLIKGFKHHIVITGRGSCSTSGLPPVTKRYYRAKII